MELCLQVVFIILLQVIQLRAFSSGPPLSTCEYMTPHHSDTKGQSGPSPYNITVSNSSYNPGDNLTVSISGSKNFTGFMLQVQSINAFVPWPVGEFIEIDNETKNIHCSGGQPKNTVGHNNPEKVKWTSRQFTWKAPRMSAGDIHFVATIVENYFKFWVRVTSAVITGPPTENITRGTPSESFQIKKSGCGDTKGCYSLPTTCTGSADCNYLFTYQVSDGNVTIEMSAKERYVSVAFNDRKLMDKMDSIMCATMATNLGELRHYDSHGHSVIRNTLLGHPDISLQKIAFEDGTIKCRVIRKLFSSTPFFKNLTTKWYLLFAHGKTSPSGSGQYHHSNRSNTAETVDLSVPEILLDEQSQVKDKITKDGCGETKICYSEPKDCKASSDCIYLLTIRQVKGKDANDSEQVEFEISGKGQWISIGFDKDKKMPDTDAMICADANGRVSVDHYLADNRYGIPTKTLEPSSLVKLFAESKGGVVSCRFKRNMRDPKMADLTQQWYLVYASGPMQPGGSTIGQHTIDPRTSPQMVVIGKISALTADVKDSSKISAHGVLMVIAWIGFASLGIFMARYMKVAFGDKEMLGTRIWFTFHRSFMLLTVVLTIISVILVFVDVGGWSYGAGAHSYTGIIVVLLAVIQPIIALFRPSPGDEKRYIFNWAHRGVGLSSLLVAVVTVFLGIRLDGAGLNNTALYIMIVYCVGVAIVIVYDAYISLNKSGKAGFKLVKGETDENHVTLEPNFKLVKGETDENHVILEPIGGKFIASRKFLLGFLTLLVFGVVVSLVVLIAAGGQEGHDHLLDH
ncbi:ferric-chelate reductase 1-like isoform X3 [Montipora capricornis]|uniref:ferric-chelate reductase 1-like isoform X3 n=1 Tax=Montipora capricornis TaxID=246305 RepID=UPI0035F1F407